MGRVALALLAVWPAMAGAQTAPDVVVDAQLIEPVTRYGHDALGTGEEWGALRLRWGACATCGADAGRDVIITLPATRVFEDVVARRVDLDGDGLTEAVIVVESDMRLGSALVVYGAAGTRAATPFIGERNRWLAPVGVGNLDGKPGVEIAYVDRPHLARELVVVRYADGALTEVARAAGFTNHQFGDAMIGGGVRSCAGRDSMIVASADWTRALDVTLQGGKLVVREVGAVTGPADLAAFLACD